MTQMNLSTKQKQTHGLVVAKGEGVGEEMEWEFGVSKRKYGMDKQQGPTVEHRELYSVSYNKWKRIFKKECIHICITESLCCTAKINTTL